MHTDLTRYRSHAQVTSPFCEIPRTNETAAIERLPQYPHVYMPKGVSNLGSRSSNSLCWPAQNPEHTATTKKHAFMCTGAHRGASFQQNQIISTAMTTVRGHEACIGVAEPAKGIRISIARLILVGLPPPGQVINTYVVMPPPRHRSTSPDLPKQIPYTMWLDHDG